MKLRKIFSKKLGIFFLLGLTLIMAFVVFVKWPAEAEISPPAPVAPVLEPTPPPVLSDAQLKALDLYEQGLKLYYDRQYDDALELFNQALSLDSGCYQALNGKGASYAFLGRYDEGIDLIQQAIAINSDFVYAHFNLGLAHELAGDWTEAIRAYQDALALDLNDVWSYYGIASIYGRQGNVEKVIEYLKPAINLQADVRDVAREEKDFASVKNDSRFQALLTEPSRMAVRVPILYYHSVAYEAGNELRIPPEQFEEQMKYLAENGYNVITLDQLYNALYGKNTLPDKPVAITFDDGYRDNFTNAFPIMQRYNFPGTVFMVSGYIGGDGFLTAGQLKEMQGAGWTIGGHGENHVNLAEADRETILSELKKSRYILENLLGRPLRYIAYPFGGYNGDVMELARADGYLAGFTANRGWTDGNIDPFALPRVYCYAGMGIAELERRLTHPAY